VAAKQRSWVRGKGASCRSVMYCRSVVTYAVGQLSCWSVVLSVSSLFKPVGQLAVGQFTCRSSLRWSVVAAPFLPPGGSIGPRYVLKLLFSET
jgi:hypothetical protein